MTFEKVKEIIVDNLGVEDITLESKFTEDLRADSLDFVEIVEAIEDSFDIEIPDEVYDHIVTVGDIVEYVNSVI
ncbi:MAG: acyl carrier protein [Anaerotignum sp.]|nr:acyl carrier protein [Anaerotignum sp.]MBP3306882.1 acyl carrier protein [Anaerotignum sp.]MBP3629676.1 acyl carrier protein [Anaerotignum sp.]